MFKNNYVYLAAVIFDSTAVVNLLATAKATSEIRAGELPCGVKMYKTAEQGNNFLQLSKLYAKRTC